MFKEGGPCLASRRQVESPQSQNLLLEPSISKSELTIFKLYEVRAGRCEQQGSAWAQSQKHPLARNERDAPVRKCSSAWDIPAIPAIDPTVSSGSGRDLGWLPCPGSGGGRDRAVLAPREGRKESLGRAEDSGSARVPSPRDVQQTPGNAIPLQQQSGFVCAQPGCTSVALRVQAMSCDCGGVAARWVAWGGCRRRVRNRFRNRFRTF